MRNLYLALCLFSFSTAVADTLHLRNATFDPSIDVPSVSLRANQASGPAYYVAAFQGARTTAEREALEAATGVEFVAYVPYNAFVVLASPLEVERLRSRSEWVGRFEPGYKIANDIGTRPLFSEARRLESALGNVRLTVTLFDGAELGRFPSEAVGAGFEVLGTAKVGPRWVIELRGPTHAAQRIAFIEEVGYVEESSDRTFRNDITRWVVQSNQTNVNTIWDRGIHGEGQVAGLIDGGVYRGHDMFRDPVNNTPGPNHRKLVYYSSSQGINSSSAHGTHTGNTFAGDQSPITGSTFRNGIAYGAKLAFTELSDVWGGGLYAALMAQHNAGARVHSNSWGDDGTTAYTSDCQQIDQYSWDEETGLVAFAVTNLSLLKTPENAKSVLAVGATNQAPGQATIGSGGAGPTIDGRRKPEIFAPGIDIISARNGTTNQWRTMSGTSMACPSVSGCGSLVRQYLEQNRMLVRFMTRRVRYTGALVRAILMNGSVDITGAAGYPSNAEGWGRVLLANVLTFVGDLKTTYAMDLPNESGMTAGGSIETRFVVEDSNTPLRVTMSFTDYPAQVFVTEAAVNDVDVEVIAPGGTVYKGNVISNGQSSAGGNADLKNSTEMVILPQPALGEYRVRAIARTVNQGVRQGASVVVNGRIRALR